MAHHTYRTEALVLKTLPRGDSDMFVQMYTKDFGYIGAVATGLRKDKSKLRYSLQEYCHSDVTLVHGKTGWRITGATPIENYFYEHPQKQLVARLFSVVKLLAGSEEENEKVFSAVIGACENLKNDDQTDAVELLAMVRILHALGYIDGEQVVGYVSADSWNDELLKAVLSDKKQLTTHINQGIEASQL